jgi:hypothetical protein
MKGEPVRPELQRLYLRVLRKHLAEMEAKYGANVLPFRR